MFHGYGKDYIKDGYQGVKLVVGTKHRLYEGNLHDEQECNKL